MEPVIIATEAKRGTLYRFPLLDNRLRGMRTLSQLASWRGLDGAILVSNEGLRRVRFETFGWRVHVPELTTGKRYSAVFDTMYRVNFFWDGVAIGYWAVEKALQDQYGRFYENEYGKSLLGNKWFGGSCWQVKNKVRWALDNLPFVTPQS
jgi:hypothetical protein